MTTTTLRYRAIDSARGLAIVIMVVSHSYRLMSGSTDYRLTENPLWQAILLAAKSSPALFFLCFGCMVGVAYTRPSRALDLRRASVSLWKRGLLVMLSYKLLVVLELAARGGSADRIVRALTYRSLAAWVEVLDFYAVVLLVAPGLIWLWRRSPEVVRWLLPLALSVAFVRLQAPPWPADYRVAQAMLVGRLPFNNFPVLPYLVVVVLGMLLGEKLYRLERRTRWATVGICAAASVSLFGVYLIASGGDPATTLPYILTSQLKHPPRLVWVAWITAVAFVLTGLCIALQGIQRQPPRRWSPLEILGRQALFAFNFHFVAIFGVGGLLLGWRSRLDATDSLIFTAVLLCLCVAGTSAWENRRVLAERAGLRLPGAAAL
jgi:hypothetical protein